MNDSNKRLLIYIVATIYILLAFGWWSILLLRKNDEVGAVRLELLREKMQRNGTFTNEEMLHQTKEYTELDTKQHRQIWMIWGEGFVMFIGLLIGLWAVYNSLQKEMRLAYQQKNFLLSITHELKSPIASIQLVLQTLQKRKLEEAQTNSLLQSANKETERLNELVNNILLSARLETSYEPLFEEINMSVLLEDIISKLKLRFPNVNFIYEKKELPLLRGDRQGLISVFTNLLENAVKYSKNQPTIHLKNAYEHNHFVFEVADNGAGIPTSETKKIFEKFYRIGNEETRKSKGTGLGLYIVCQVIKMHRGLIQVLENKPSGTIFKITLPS